MFLRLLVHLGTVANFAYAIHFQLNLVIPEKHGGKIRNSFGGPWKFLTFWNLWIQLFYSILALLNLFIGTDALVRSKASGLQRARDFFFSTLSFPIGIFVAAMFWSLWFIDRELVMPKIYDEFIPVYVNHMLHTTCIPVCLFELVSVYHLYVSKKCGIAATAFFCGIYLAWTLYIANVGGFWVYPLFKALPVPWRYVFMVFCAGLGGLLNLIGDLLNSIVWGSVLQQASKSHPTTQPKQEPTTSGYQTRSKKKAKKLE